MGFTYRVANTGHGMNERADELAAQGAQGLRRRNNAIYVSSHSTGSASRRTQCLTESRGGRVGKEEE